MIISRSPLRITLGGGGTDLPSYYREHEGFLISAAISKYVYVTVLEPFAEGIFLKYSEMENVDRVEQIKHPIIRETLKLMDFKSPIEITTLADIPSGTGLGSSGSFTTALLKSLYSHQKYYFNNENIAELACQIEIDRLGEPVGKQDQYISAIGGLTCFTFHKNDTVTIEPLNISQETLFELEDNLLLFFTGFSRRAGNILNVQNEKSKLKNNEMLENLHFTKELGYRSQSALVAGDINLFGQLMNEHWEFKRSRSNNISNPKINELYKLGIENGAIGGKLVGAGGGGFLMFLAENKKLLRSVMLQSGLKEVRFNFDFEGTKLIKPR